jgi:RNA polymerase sigma factor (sigma-70 family)
MEDRMDDTLLARYAENHDPQAWGELTRRHGGMVHAAALRQVGGDGHLAEDVTQAVFLLLARKAGSIADSRSAAGWLYSATRFAAKDALRARRRRVRHEQQAAALRPEADMPNPDDRWSDIAPLLDAAMATLRQTDRQLVLLRYFEDHPLAEVSAMLGIRPNTAAKRLSRAIERLRREFAARGVAMPSAALATTIAAHAARTRSVPALSAPANSTSALAIARGASRLLLFAKVQAFAAIAAIALAAGALTTACAIGLRPRSAAPAQIAATPIAATQPAVDPLNPAGTGDTLLVGYLAAIKTPLLDELRKTSTAVDPAAMQGTTPGWELLTTDGEDLRTALSIGEHAQPPTVWAHGSQTAFADPEEARKMAVNFAGMNFFEIEEPGGFLVSPGYRLEFGAHFQGTINPGPGSVDLSLTYLGDEPGGPTQLKCNKVTLAAGRSLYFLRQIGQTDNQPVWGLLILQAVPCDTDAAHVLMNSYFANGNTDWVTNGGPPALARVAAMMRSNRSAPSAGSAAASHWQTTIANNIRVALVAVGHPDADPHVWWDGDGSPVAVPTYWGKSRGERGYVFRIIYPTGPQTLPKVGDSDDRTGIFNTAGDGVAELRYDWPAPPAGKPLSAQIGVGTGKWTLLTTLKTGEDRVVDGWEYAVMPIENVFPHDETDDLMMWVSYTPRADVEIAWVGIDGKHGEHWLQSEGPIAQRPPYSAGKFHSLNEHGIPVAEKFNHIAVYSRPRVWVKMSGMADAPLSGGTSAARPETISIEPANLPPPATGSPGASLLAMLAAESGGDVDGMLRYVYAPNDATRHGFIDAERCLIACQRMLHAAGDRFGGYAPCNHVLGDYLGIGDQGLVASAAAEWRIDGQTARAIGCRDAINDTFAMRLDHGIWKVDLTDPKMQIEPQEIAEWRRTTPIFDAAARDVVAGRYASLAQLHDALAAPPTTSTAP